MSKYLNNLASIALFLAPSFSFGMGPETRAQQSKRLKIQTSDDVEFEIEWGVAQQSEALKNMIEDIGEEAEQSIPLPEISKKQFDLLLPVMEKLANLQTELQASEEKLARQLQQIVADLKSNNQPLNSQQLIEFIAGANYLDIPLVEPALKALARRILKKDELLQLVALEDKLKDLWHMHPAKELMLEGLSLKHPNVIGVIKSSNGNLISWSFQKGTIKVWDKNNPTKPTTLHHPKVSDVIDSMDGNNLISWSRAYGTIKIWDKTNLDAEPITLHHPEVNGVLESLDGKNFISWSFADGTIKIWDKNYLDVEPITFQHPFVKGVIESMDGNNLISWSRVYDTIKIWDKTNLDAEPITLHHPEVNGVLESRDGKNLISWSWRDGTIKIWDKNNLQAKPITFHHPEVWGVLESLNGNLGFWSYHEGTIKIWDKNNAQAETINLQHLEVAHVIESGDGNLISWGDGTITVWDKALYNPTPELIQLLLTVYFVSKGQKFELTAQELAQFKAIFNILSPTVQHMLEKEAPDFIAALKAEQK